MESIYEKCPVLKNNMITLRRMEITDAEDLLKCYSDEKSVKFFNSDNCHGDDFHYTTLDRVRKAIEGWNYCYDMKDFVRITIVMNSTGEKIGTIEMFNRGEAACYGVHGILRIDLRSCYEKENIISAILDLADNNFYELFDVECIMTKAINEAEERISALIHNGYKAADNFEMKNYYYKKSTNIVK